MAKGGLMIALGAHPHDEPDGDEGEVDGEDTGLPEHDYKHDAADVLEALHKKDANELAHALETFVKKCMG